MSYDLEQRVRSDLRADEKLLWIGQPAQGLLLRGNDAFTIPFSLFWAGVVVYLERGALKQPPDFFALLGIPFVLFGIYLVIGRFFVDAAVRARTYYALTNQRAIILTGFWTRELKSLWLRNLPQVSLKEGRGTRGTIEFGPSAWPMSLSFHLPGRSPYQPPAFELIEGPQHVYDLLRAAQRTATEVGA